MFYLEELNDQNFKELSNLRIKKSQKSFVLDFQGCVDYKKENPFLRVFGIKMDEKYIGLTAFARWDSDTNIPLEERWTWFDEFFLDEKYQHHGYSEEIVTMILEKIKEIYHPNFIILSVCNDNETAKHLYRKLGFKDTGLIYIKKTDEIIPKVIYDEKDEIVMRLDIK